MTEETAMERVQRWAKELREALGEDANEDDVLDDLVAKAVSKLYEIKDGWTPELGKEAEELRAGIEELISCRGSGDDDVGDWFVKELQKLLDKTDARDSLKWLTEKDHTTIIYFEGTLYMKLLGGTYKIVSSPKVEALVRQIVEESQCPPESSSRSRSKTKTPTSST